MRAMKTLLITAAMVLLLGAPVAHAEWQKAGVSNNAGDAFTLYLDPATLQRTGKLAKMWSLHDFKELQSIDGQLYLAEKTQLEFDCEAKKVRILATIDCALKMCAGEIVYSDADATEWSAVARNTLGETAWKLACAGK
jgi:hypothetical protein